jgi:hypothetical protein
MRSQRMAIPLEQQQFRPPFAFHYAPSLSDEALEWYSRFEMLVTHDPLPAEQVERLHAGGTRLLLYEWSVAFYESRATEWQRSLIEMRARDLLNEKPLTGFAGSPEAGAWYFDPASPEHELGRAEDLARRLQDANYDGVFFDTTTILNVHPEARAEYEKRHPETPYDAAFSRFLRQLRRTLPRAILFTNQGYRGAEHYLPYVDWDLTESLITRPVNGSFAPRQWNDPADPWNSIDFVMETMIEPLGERYPHLRFGHLNYVSGSDREAIRLVVAAAQLFGGEAYAASSSPAREIDPIYFRDRGTPMSDRIDLAGGNAAYRLFDRGLIAVTAASEPVTIPLPKKGARDHFTGQLFCGERLTLPPAGAVPRAYFFDRADCRTR